MTTPATWDPELYRRYDDHRGRPFLDLVGRIGAEAPREVVDLGCGPGHLTSLLAGRWPSARVLASDGYPEMVAAARANGVDATLLDVRDFVPGPETDVVVTNAVLHWVPEHRELVARWVSRMPAGGWLAVQVPGNGPAPSHVLIRELLAEEPWASRVSSAAASAIDFDVAPPVEYAQLVAAERPGAVVDAWETTYVHPLAGDDPVLEWVSGTTLRPVSAELSDDDRAQFRTELGERLRLAYPPDGSGTTWFGFRRVFCVVHCP